MSNDLTRRRITSILDEIVRLRGELRRRGVDTRQKEDQEAVAIVKRITESAYNAETNSC